jgi:hypothetical protein
MMKKLKKLITLWKSIFPLVLFMVSCYGHNVSAQVNSEDQSSLGTATRNVAKKSINIGFRFGTTISEFTYQQPYTNIAQGFIAGALVRYNFSKSFALQLETDYSQRGGRLTNFNLSGFLKAENQYLRMHNLEIPLFAQYSVPLGGADLKLNAGPAIGFNLHSGTVFEGTMFGETSFHTYTGEANVSSSINSYEISAIGGIGFEFDISDTLFLFVDARYKYGVTPVYEGYSYVLLEKIQGDLKNHSMSFSIGFGF